MSNFDFMPQRTRLERLAVLGVSLAGLALAGIVVPDEAAGQQRDMDKYFAGKTVRIISTYGAGGGNDTVARSFQRFAPKYFPKSTKFIVQNISGGNGDAGATVVATSKPDGLTLAVLWGSNVLGDMLGSDRPGWSWSDFEPVITYSFPLDSAPLLVRKDLATSWDQVASGKAGKMKVGATTGLSIWPGLVLLAGHPVKIVAGYSTNAEATAAADRGEVDATTASLVVYLKTYPDWVRNGKMVAFWRSEKPPIPESAMKALGLKKQPPYILDVVKLPEDLRNVYITAQKLPTYHILFAPKKTPADVLAYLREKMAAAVQDPEMVKWVTLRGLNASFVGGVELAETYQQVGQKSGVEKKLLGAYFSGDPKLLKGTPYEGRWD